MLISPMNMFDNSQVNMSYFNSLLISKGGKALKTDKPKISMREFIFKLIKTFRKDFNKKKRGGVASINDSSFSNITNISDLSFASYTYPTRVELARDIY